MASKLKEEGRNINVVVIDKKDVSLHKMGAMRSVVLGNEWGSRILMKRDGVLDKDELIIDTVDAIQDNQVILATTNKKIDYDVLVLAIGAENLSICEPKNNLKEEDIVDYYNKMSKKIQAANKIALIGGGAVGIELAAEIKTNYKEKQVHLFHSGLDLITTKDFPFPKKFTDKVSNQLDNLGIKVHVNAKVIEPNLQEKSIIEDEPTIKTSNNESFFDFDLILVSIGVGHESAKKSLPNQWLDDKGLVKVNSETLLVENTNNVFAIGDCNNVKEMKIGAFSQLSVPIIAKNVLQVLDDKIPTNKVKKADKPIMFLSLGNDAGLGCFSNFVVPNFLVKRIKSQDLMTNIIRTKVFKIEKLPIP